MDLRDQRGFDYSVKIGSGHQGSRDVREKGQREYPEDIPQRRVRPPDLQTQNQRRRNRDNHTGRNRKPKDESPLRSLPNPRPLQSCSRPGRPPEWGTAAIAGSVWATPIAAANVIPVNFRLMPFAAILTRLRMVCAVVSEGGH